MTLATGKFGKKIVFLLFILALIVSLALMFPPANLPLVIIMNILIGYFFFSLFKVFVNVKLAFSFSLPIFLITSLVSLKLFDPLNLILAISLSFAVAILIK